MFCSGMYMYVLEPKKAVLVYVCDRKWGSVGRMLGGSNAPGVLYRYQLRFVPDVTTNFLCNA